MSENQEGIICVDKRHGTLLMRAAKAKERELGLLKSMLGKIPRSVLSEHLEPSDVIALYQAGIERVEAERALFQAMREDEE